VCSECDGGHTRRPDDLGEDGDTAREMSQTNVEAFKRGLDAGNRGDVDAMLEVLAPDVTWHSAFHTLLGGETTVFRGHDGVRELMKDLSDAFGHIEMDMSEIRSMGDRVVAIGRYRARGGASGAQVETPIAFVAEFKNGKAVSQRAYLDPEEALEAVGLPE
jgi:ketosteroid isomerase-like protein